MVVEFQQDPKRMSENRSEPFQAAGCSTTVEMPLNLPEALFSLILFPSAGSKAME